MQPIQESNQSIDSSNVVTDMIRLCQGKIDQEKHRSIEEQDSKDDGGSKRTKAQSEDMQTELQASFTHNEKLRDI